MYLRTTTSRPRKDGSRVRYVALAHNEWDPDTRRSKAKVLYNFGREDQLDRDALTRLVASINRYLGVDEAPAEESTATPSRPAKESSARPPASPRTSRSTFQRSRSQQQPTPSA